MAIRLHFLGAARNVTGSRFLVEADGFRVLVDCGLYQERNFQDRNWDKFLIPPDTIDAVLLTHSHLDHCGLLPKLCKEGFRGKIFCTEVTSEIIPIVLYDSAHIQEEDARYKAKRLAREGRRSRYPTRPLYTTGDVTRTLAKVRKVQYNESVEVAPGFNAVFHEAGHIIGSSMIRLTADDREKKRTILFSGDVGRWDRPIIRNPDPFEYADYVITESTYGDRLHGKTTEILNQLADLINDTYERGGNVIIPSFAIERSQEVLYRLNMLLKEKRIPKLMVFLDSPMAVKVTEVFKKHPELLNDEMKQLLEEDYSPFSFEGLKLVQSREESQSINSIRGTAIVIAGSGMCVGGRIKHHLSWNIGRPESTIIFVGYQASGTLGRSILDGAKRARVLGEILEVKAKVAQIDGFSGHADKHELIRFLRNLKEDPRRVFIVHGGSNVTESFGKYLYNNTGWDIAVPKFREAFELE